MAMAEVKNECMLVESNVSILSAGSGDDALSNDRDSYDDEEDLW